MRQLCALFLCLGLVLTALPARADHAQGATLYEIRSLQADLDDLDAVVAAMPASSRTSDLQRREDLIRDRVAVLRDQVTAHREDNTEGLGATHADVRQLRSDIAELRTDMTRSGNLYYAGAATLPAGTEIRVSLNQPLSSSTARLEDQFTATVVESIWMDNRIAIPAGATVRGTVVKVDRPERPARGGELKLRFDTIRTEAGQTMNLHSRVVSIDQGMDVNHKGQKRAGYGALLGGVLGAIMGDGTKGALIGAAIGAAGGIASTKGNDVDLPEGTMMTLKLDDALVMH